MTHSKREKNILEIILEKLDETCDLASLLPKPPPKKRAKNTRLPIPRQILEMRNLAKPDYGNFGRKCANFYHQARFMENYEDDSPVDWKKGGVFLLDFYSYYCTYNDLSFNQLRNYFAWRTGVRKGVFKQAPIGAAYIYLYELVNGIGATDVDDILNKMMAFEKGYIDAGMANERMRDNLRLWMRDLVIVNGLPPDRLYDYRDEAELKREKALSILRAPDQHDDDSVFDALAALTTRKPLSSSVIKKKPEEGKRLFAKIWRALLAGFKHRRRGIFNICFGMRGKHFWLPLSNAIYFQRQNRKDCEYIVNDCLSYSCANGVWRESSYAHLAQRRARFNEVMREIDRQLRLYLKTGAPLRENGEGEWIADEIARIIADDKKSAAKAAIDAIKIDISGLDSIRDDAAETRGRLLTGDEICEDIPAPAPAFARPESGPLDSDELEILRVLLKGESAESYLRSRRLMASIVADGINEALFEELGDNALECDGDKLAIVEDYRTELGKIMGRLAL